MGWKLRMAWVIVSNATLACFWWALWRLTGHTRGNFFQAGKMRLHYTDEGRGEAVLLVHGFAVGSDMNWRYTGVAQALRKRYRVIGIDMRGHGLSGAPERSEDCGLEMVEDLARLLDHLGIEKAHVVGYSMGGFITLRFVATHPERILCAIPAAAGWEEVNDENLAVLDSIADSLASGGGFVPLIKRLEAGEGEPNATRVAIINRVLCFFNREKPLAHVMRAFHEFAVEKEALRKNRVPVLSIAGDRDPLCTGVETLTDTMANQRTCIIKGGDHLSTLVSRAYIENVLAFLSEHGGANSRTEAAG